MISTFSFTDGSVAACVDVLQITHAALSMVKFFLLIWHKSSAPVCEYFVQFLLCMVLLIVSTRT